MPGVDIILALAEGLGVSPDKIFREAGLLPQEGEGEDRVGFWELWGIMKRMKPAVREEVVRYALFREREGRTGGGGQGGR